MTCGTGGSPWYAEWQPLAEGAKESSLKKRWSIRTERGDITQNTDYMLAIWLVAAFIHSSRTSVLLWQIEILSGWAICPGSHAGMKAETKIELRCPKSHTCEDPYCLSASLTLRSQRCHRDRHGGGGGMTREEKENRVKQKRKKRRKSRQPVDLNTNRSIPSLTWQS